MEGIKIFIKDNIQIIEENIEKALKKKIWQRRRKGRTNSCN